MTTQAVINMASPAVVMGQQPKDGLRIMVRATRGFGITQAIIGPLTVLFGIVSAARFPHIWTTHIGGAFWGGVIFTIAGIIGILSSHRPKSSPLNSVNLVFSLVSALIAVFNLVLFSSAVEHYNNCAWDNPLHDDLDDLDEEEIFLCKESGTGAGIHTIVLVIAVVEIFIGTLAASFCCVACCRCCRCCHEPAPSFQPQIFAAAGQTNMAMSSEMTPQPMYLAQQPQAVYVGQNPQVVYTSNPPQYEATERKEPIPE